MDDWPDWSRLEVHTWSSPRACLIAGSARTGELLERALLGAGWQITARFYGPHPDPVALGEACLDPAVHAVVMGGHEGAEETERDAMRRLWPLAGSLARWRDDIAVIACGPFVERPEGIPDTRLYSLPAPDAVALTAPSTLRVAAIQVGAHLVGAGSVGDARQGLRTSIASLAAIMDERVEGIEVGAAAGSRTLASPEQELRHAVLEAGAYLPEAILDDETVADSLLRWSTLKGDPMGHIDRLRELRLHPWSAVDADGLRLRFAALHAALQRIDTAWAGAQETSEGHDEAPGVTVLSGGGFSTLPTAAIGLALIDSVRRPGVFTILHDHARILAPLGALPVEDDRRRLLGDLLDDALLPVGSAVLTGTIGRAGKSAGTMTISTPLGADELRLEPDGVRMVDLPPGIVASLEVDPGDGEVMGVQGQQLSLEVRGGLGGLLVDTRDIPLRLPGGDDGRKLLEAWQRPVWGGEA